MDPLIPRKVHNGDEPEGEGFFYRSPASPDFGAVVVDHRFDGVIGELTLPTGVIYVFKPSVDQHLTWILLHCFTPGPTRPRCLDGSNRR